MNLGIFFFCIQFFSVQNFKVHLSLLLQLKHVEYWVRFVLQVASPVHIKVLWLCECRQDFICYIMLEVLNGFCLKDLYIFFQTHC